MIWPPQTHTLRDGRTVEATYVGEPTGWSVRVVGSQNRVVTGRVIETVLAELLEPGPDQRPSWFRKTLTTVAGKVTPMGYRFICPCCESFSLEEPPPGTYEICAVCDWEDDPVQFDDIDYEGGANTESLRQARANLRPLA